MQAYWCERGFVGEKQPFPGGVAKRHGKWYNQKSKTKGGGYGTLLSGDQKQSGVSRVA